MSQEARMTGTLPSTACVGDRLASVMGENFARVFMKIWDG